MSAQPGAGSIFSLRRRNWRGAGPLGPLMGSPSAFALLVVALATGTANYLAGEADRAATARANATIAGVERLVSEVKDLETGERGFVLVGSGGLGPELSAGLRAATLPGAEAVLTALAGVSGVLRTGMQVVEGVGRVAGWQRLRDLAEAGDALLALKDVEARRAFLRTLRGVVDARGQAVTAVDRLYLANAIPMLVIWGSRDPIVPAAHAQTVRALVPTARVEVFSGAGHWPHLDDPDRFCRVLLDFLATTPPARHDRDSWRALLADNPDGVPGWTAPAAPAAVSGT